jgi:hypothetical protein
MNPNVMCNDVEKMNYHIYLLLFIISFFLKRVDFYFLMFKKLVPEINRFIFIWVLAPNKEF